MRNMNLAFVAHHGATGIGDTGLVKPGTKDFGHNPTFVATLLERAIKDRVWNL